jgi:pyruvate dehydrogenase E2 component (dihydrolipoamide acetyltransferase)
MMATDIILPALGMSQDAGKILRWLKTEGEHITRGETLVEIETDKATVEIEAPVDGVLVEISASVGDEVPVGQLIATIIASTETSQEGMTQMDDGTVPTPSVETSRQSTIAVSPLASRIAAAHNLDLNLIKSAGRRIQKADVLTHLQNQEKAAPIKTSVSLTMASPKARRLAAEQGKDLAAIRGSGSGGAVLVADVLAAVASPLSPLEAARTPSVGY